MVFQDRIYNEWKSTGSFLWIHGKRSFSLNSLPYNSRHFTDHIAGSGKSILCSSIIQDIISLRDKGEALMAYFYFDFRDFDKQNLRNLLPSLLVQLSAQSDPCCDVLFRLYAAHDQGVQKPSDCAMIECLKEMVTLQARCPTFIVIDAPDECPIMSSIPSPREEVLELVDNLVRLHLPNLESLTLHPLSLHDESGQKQDIVDYVGCFVHSDHRMRRWRNEDKDLVIKTLSKKVDGM
ncbi:hypothetical protein BJV74DRAFT_455673 [Russula compacta]|nr:hypothetical protein BJV74DRAFT_455673 [Russula compacta]